MTRRSVLPTFDFGGCTYTFDPDAPFLSYDPTVREYDGGVTTVSAAFGSCLASGTHGMLRMFDDSVPYGDIWYAMILDGFQTSLLLEPTNVSGAAISGYSPVSIYALVGDGSETAFNSLAFPAEPFDPADFVDRFLQLGFSNGVDEALYVNATFDTITAIPEPTSAPLLAMGLAALAATRHRRPADR